MKRWFLGLLLGGPLVLGSATTCAAADPAFDLKQGSYFLEQRAFADAADALSRACPHIDSPGPCWVKLAAAAEGARRIDQARAAWREAGEADASLRESAQAETARLDRTWGVLEVRVGRGRIWPSRPLRLDHVGLLLDPALKAHAAAVTQSVREKGLAGPELHLPAGQWQVEGRDVEVPGGGSASVVAGARWLLYRPESFARPGAAEPFALPGPSLVGVGLRVVAGGSPGAADERAPVGFGLGADLGVERGPALMIAGVQWAIVPVGSAALAPERRRPTHEVLGSLGIAPILSLGPSVRLALGVHAVGGSLGEGQYACFVETEPGGTVWTGQCRLPLFGVGARVTGSLLVRLGVTGRLGLRVEPFGEGLAARSSHTYGEKLVLGTEGTLLRPSGWSGAVLRGGLRLGLDVRF